MTDFPGDTSYEQISQSIFRIESTWATGGASATAFVIGMLANSRKLILATAQHVLDVPDDQDVYWKIQQFNDTSDVVRELSFGTNKSAMGDVPYRTNNAFDVGIFILPANGNNNKLLARKDEEPIQTIDILSGSSTGTRVAWAGFPGIIEAALGFPQLCYFEGVISSMVNHSDKKIYIVDGHGAPGVSGAPVWQWSTDNNRVEVVGIVSSYHHTGDGIPGFCFFEPINTVLWYFAADMWHPDKVGDHLIVNRYGPAKTSA
jgi:hypothetical protein